MTLMYGTEDEALQHRRETLMYLLAHPEVHEQGSWCDPYGVTGQQMSKRDHILCGTTLCIAGTAAMLSGSLQVPTRKNQQPKIDGVPIDDWMLDHDEDAWFAKKGAEWLDLEEKSQYRLFGGSLPESAARQSLAELARVEIVNPEKLIDVDTGEVIGNVFFDG